jgi:DNA-directed RNA polymerase subunit K/omega
MSTAMTKEEFSEILTETAVRKFGEERAKMLSPAIQEIAASLATLVVQKIELEEEPAFFL